MTERNIHDAVYWTPEQQAKSEEEAQDEKDKCPDCGGAKEIVITTTGKSPSGELLNGFSFKKPCPTCQGTGKRQDPGMREKIIGIIKEYKLESVAVRDDVLEKKGIGWGLLWQALMKEE